MSHHLIDISAPNCAITCRKGQLICRPKDGPEKRAPMEDVGAILVNSFSATFHSQVFLEAVKSGAIVVFCDAFRPAALLLPANRATDTVLTRGQIGLSDKARKSLWHSTITAKCLSQAALARCLCPGDPRADLLEEAAATKRTDKEARCARTYWAMLASFLHVREFKRGREEGGLNDLLNYGYTVLLARMLQKMVAVGLDPTFGIGHAVRERATPLAYDLMEPFRVIVDARIVSWVKQFYPKEGGDDPFEVSQDYKRHILGFLETRIAYRGKELTTEHVIEQVLSGFRDAVIKGRHALYKPWRLESTKWDGFS